MGQLRDVVHYYTQGVQIVGLWHFVAHHWKTNSGRPINVRRAERVPKSNGIMDMRGMKKCTCTMRHTADQCLHKPIHKNAHWKDWGSWVYLCYNIHANMINIIVFRKSCYNRQSSFRSSCSLRIKDWSTYTLSRKYHFFLLLFLFFQTLRIIPSVLLKL
jgi:hypothetical protein